MNKHYLAVDYTLCSYQELEEADKQLINQAAQAAEKSYSPYSRFRVGAALVLENGQIIEGNNQENAVYPAGLCAERVALFYANARYPDLAVDTIAIAARRNTDLTGEPVTPCGACRQALLEAEQRFEHPIRLLMYGQNRILVVHNAKSLLPFSFKADFLFND